jgi:hypothetical protein
MLKMLTDSQLKKCIEILELNFGKYCNEKYLIFSVTYSFKHSLTLFKKYEQRFQGGSSQATRILA